MQNNHQQVIEQGYTFDMSTYFTEGWNIFKKQAGSYIGFSLVSIIILGLGIVLWLIPIIGILAWVLLPTLLLGGLYSFIRKSATDTATFGDFFNGFKNIPRLALYFLFMAIFYLPIILTYVLLFGSLFLMDEFTDIEEIGYQMEQLSPAVNGVGWLFNIYSFVISTIFTLTIPLVMETEYGVWQALGISRKVVSKNFFPFAIYFFLIGLITSLATLFSCGLFFILMAFPLNACFNFAAYKNILQPDILNLEGQIDDFGSGSADINTESQE